MAVKRFKDAPTPEQLRIRDRAARARKAQPPRDPTGESHDACAEIARIAKVEPFVVLDDWDHEAARIEYEGETPRADAERQALDIVRERYLKQRSLP